MSRKNIGRALEETLKEEAKSLAARAILHTLEATALGFLDLAYGNIPGADAAFESAAIWGALGAASAGIGAAIPGGSRGSGAGSSGGGRGYGYGRGSGVGAGGDCGSVPVWDAAAGGAAGGSRGTMPGGNLTVAIMGDREAAQWVGNKLMQHARNGGQMPQNPHPAYVTPGIGH